MTLGRGPVRAVTTNFVARTTAHLYGGRLVALRQPTRCVLMRPQSTSAGRTDAVASPKPRTPLAAAVVGAATAGLFLYYVAKRAKMEGASSSVRTYLKDKDSVLRAAMTSDDLTEVIAFIRFATENYRPFFPRSLLPWPFSSRYPDVASSLEAISQLHDIQCGELHPLLLQTLAEITAALTEPSSGHGVNKIVATILSCFHETNPLVRKIGDDAFREYKQAHPAIGDVFGAHYLELRSLAARGGDEAQRVAQDATDQVHRVLSGDLEVMTLDSADGIDSPLRVDPDSVARADHVLLSSIGQLRVMLSQPLVNELLKVLPPGTETAREILRRVRQQIPLLSPWETRQLLDVMKEKIAEMKAWKTLRSLLAATIDAEMGVKAKVDELVDKEYGSDEAFRILLDIRELGREVYKNRAAAEKLAKKLGVQLPEQDSLLPPIAVSGKAADGDAS